jgi:hypothetical protein
MSFTSARLAEPAITPSADGPPTAPRGSRSHAHHANPRLRPC